MNKRNKKIILIIVVVILIIIGFIVFKTIHSNKTKTVSNVSVKATDKIIDSAKYNIIKGNLYYLYSENEESSFNNDYDEILNLVSEYLKSNYSNIDVLIDGIYTQKALGVSMDEIIENEQYVNYVKENDNQPKYDHYIDVYQIQDGIVLINKKYRVLVDSNNAIQIDGLDNNPFMQEKIDQSNFIGVTEALKIVTNEINSNLETLRIESIDSLSGTETLEFDGTNTYYNYQINGSYVKVNALNGEIIDESIVNKEYSIQ